LEPFYLRNRHDQATPGRVAGGFFIMGLEVSFTSHVDGTPYKKERKEGV